MRVCRHCGGVVATVRGPAACDTCKATRNRAKATDRQRAYRWRQTTEVIRGRVDGKLEVTCWCEATVVLVDPDLVRAGRTASCGVPSCREAA